MTDFVLWLDSEKAAIFNFTVTGIEKTHLEKVGQHNQQGDSNSEHFYRDLAVKLKNASQLLILGPGLAKNHFKTHLETHHTGDLVKKIVGIETVDHPTDNQILAAARKFYKTYDLYNNPIRQST